MIDTVTYRFYYHKDLPICDNCADVKKSTDTDNAVTRQCNGTSVSRYGTCKNFSPRMKRKLDPRPYTM